MSFWLHQNVSNSFLNPIMLTLTGEIFWIIVLCLSVLYIFWKKLANYYPLIYLSAIGATITDLTAFRVFKPFFGRLRPCHEFPEKINLIVEACGGSLSFPSNHASNAMVVSTLVCCFVGSKYKIIPIAIGLLIGFTRVYLGVHYLGDVMFGSFFGSCVGLLLYFVWRKLKIKHN